MLPAVTTCSSFFERGTPFQGFHEQTEGMLPTIRGVIDRRVLVNYRVEPAALERALPEPFRPQTVDGNGIADVCLVRVRDLRPKGLPAWLGIGCENAAHRIAAEWEADGECCTEMYVPWRDTDSTVNTLLGGRLLPGSTTVRRSTSVRATVTTILGCVVRTGRLRSGWSASASRRCPAVASSTRWTRRRGSSSKDRSGTRRTSASGSTRRWNWIPTSERWSRWPLRKSPPVTSSRSRGGQRSTTPIMREIIHEWHEGDSVYAAPTD